MPRRLLACALLVGLLSPGLLPAASAEASTGTVVLDGAVGSPFADRTTTVTDETTGQLTLTGTAQSVHLAGESPDGPGVDLVLTAPTGSTLVPGTFELASTADATHLGLALTSAGQCDGVSGQLTIVTATFTDGSPTVLDADGSITCGTGGASRLEVRFGSERPYTSVLALAVALGNVPVGLPEQATASYTNTGTTPVTISGVAVTDTAGGNTTTWVKGYADACITTLAPGGTCSVPLTATPGSAGFQNGLITFTDSTPLGSHRRPLSSFGLAAPPGQRAAATAYHAVLSWTAPTSNPRDPITGYAIYRGDEQYRLSLVDTTETTSWQGPAPAGQEITYFAIVAQSATGPGARSPIRVVGTSTQLIVTKYDEEAGHSIAVNPRGSGPGTTLVKDGKFHGQVAVSPNGTMAAYTSGGLFDEDTSEFEQVDLYARRTDGSGGQIVIANTPAHEYSPSFSPDGKRVAWTLQSNSSLGRTCYATISGTAVGARSCTPAAGFLEASWLNATTLVASTADYSGLVRLPLNGARPTAIPGTADGYQPSVSPSGAAVAFVHGGDAFTERLKIVDLATGSVRTLTNPEDMLFGTPTWTRDGKELYVTGFTETESSVYRVVLASRTFSRIARSRPSEFPVQVAVSTPDTTGPTIERWAVPSVAWFNSITPYFSATDALNPVTSYVLVIRRAAIGSSSYQTLPARTLTQPTAIPTARGYTYCFRVRAIDRVGNSSAYTRERCTSTPFDDRSLTRSAGFTDLTHPVYYAGTAARATGRGQTLTQPGAVAVKRLYVIATTCPSCGTVDVLVNGVRVGSINLYSQNTLYKTLFSFVFSVRSGPVVLKVTSSGKPVIIDGLGFAK